MSPAPAVLPSSSRLADLADLPCRRAHAPPGAPQSSAHLAPGHPEEEEDDQVDRVDDHTGHQTHGHCVNAQRDPSGHGPGAVGRREERPWLGHAGRGAGVRQEGSPGSPRSSTHLWAASPTTPYHTALAPRKRQTRRTQQVARWTRVKRLRGGRSQMDSQMCLSKKPRCSSATSRRRDCLRAASPGDRAGQASAGQRFRATPPATGTGMGPYLPPAPPSPRGRRWPQSPLTATR